MTDQGHLAEVERLRGLLRRLEWRGPTLAEEGVCPACDAAPSDGHQSDCWLAAELDPETAEASPTPEG